MVTGRIWESTTREDDEVFKLNSTGRVMWGTWERQELKLARVNRIVINVKWRREQWTKKSENHPLSNSSRHRWWPSYPGAISIWVIGYTLTFSLLFQSLSIICLLVFSSPWEISLIYMYYELSHETRYSSGKFTAYAIPQIKFFYSRSLFWQICYFHNAQRLLQRFTYATEFILFLIQYPSKII